MEDLLFELLAVLLETLFEVLIELLGAALLDSLFRMATGAVGKVLEAVEDESGLRAPLVFGLIGLAVGGLSVLIFPHQLIHTEHSEKFHGISLVISPVVSGLVMSRIGSSLRQQGKKVVPIESFGYGFIFAFGMALVRFLFAK